MKNKSLGRGLNALIPQTSENNAEKKEIIFLDINKLKTRQDQPRKEFDQESLNNLSESIKKYGLIQPIITVKKGEDYIIIAGERRYRASKLAKLEKIPAIIKDISNQEIDVISLIENIQREDLNPIEEANAYKELKEKHNLTQQEIADTVGKSRSYIANTIRLLNLDDNTKLEIKKGNITNSQARSLLSIEDINQRKAMTEKLKDKKINIRDIEQTVKTEASAKTNNENREDDLDKILFEDFSNRFIEAAGSKVEIKKIGSTYKVIIDCYSEEDMENLLERLEENA